MKRTKGFTLVELLVVISIIAVLLSILMPSLKKAREQARLIICKARQSQLGLANIMYADEVNDGVTLNGVSINSSGNIETGVGWDACSLNSDKYSYSQLGLLFRTGILDQSRKSATIFFCPSILKNNACSADFIDPDLRPGQDGYGMTSLDRIMFDNWSVGWTIQIMTGVQVRNKWSSGVFPNMKKEELKSTPSKWGYNLASETKISFISDPWPAYHNGKGTAWHLDGHAKTWDGRTLKTRWWYEGMYNLPDTNPLFNPPPPPRYVRTQILINYGSCFRWIDGVKGATRKADNPIF